MLSYLAEQLFAVVSGVLIAFAILCILFLMELGNKGAMRFKSIALALSIYVGVLLTTILVKDFSSIIFLVASFVTVVGVYLFLHLSTQR